MEHKLALKLVFSNPRYIALSSVIFTAMFIPLTYIAEYLFFQPRWILFVPGYSVFGFSLVVVVSVLTGLVLSMGIYRIKILKASKKKMSSGFIGSIIGASAGACSTDTCSHPISRRDTMSTVFLPVCIP